MLVNGKVLMSLVMLAIFVAMVAMAATYPPDARFLPFVIGIPGTLLCLLQVGADIAAARRARPEADAAAATAEFAGPGPEVRREITLLACLVGLAAAILLLGFWLAIPAFIVLFLRFHEREEWRFTLALAIGGWLTLYLIFDQLLGILVFEGFLFGAVVG